MAMKRLFNKKKDKSSEPPGQQLQSVLVNDENSSIKSGRSSISSSSNKTSRTNKTKPTFQAVEDDKSVKSFQYHYNSNTNSLFSSKQTMSTGISSYPSSSGSYGKNNHKDTNEQSKFTSIGRPLRVLHEEDSDEEFQKAAVEEEYEEEKIPRRLSSIKQSNLPDDISISQTEKSTLSISASSIGDVPQTQLQPHFATPGSASVSGPSSLHGLPNVVTDVELQQFLEFIKRQLKQLASAISNIILQISQSVLNLTKASINISEAIEMTIQVISGQKYISYLPPNQLNTINSLGLRKLVKNILYLLDNLLLGDVYDKSKALVLKNLHDLFLSLKLITSNSTELSNFIMKMSPKLFAIGSTPQDFPNHDKITKIMSTLLSKDKQELFSDQNGSFIAPVLKGFQSPSLSVITFIFGFPELSREHYDIIKFFSTQSNDMHFIVQTNKIELATLSQNASSSKTMNNSKSTIPTRPSKAVNKLKLKSPFRVIDSNRNHIPISMSLSTNSSKLSSGTLGGYIYPQVPLNCNNPRLLKYKGQVFGLTCAHVVLTNDSSDDPHPTVSIPSPVLINLYKNALVNERLHHSPNTPEYKAYNDAINHLDGEYPIKKVIIEGKKVLRNLPPESFGCIIWGERVIQENKLSDMAIIKVNESNKKFINNLGDDLQLSQNDPSLILSNLSVKKTISLSQRKNGISNNANLNVFKVGSTTGYTRARLNGMKMIYWSDGSLKSSEFVISSTDKSEGFASGGDSGAWVLTKMSDVANVQGGRVEEYNGNDDSKGVLGAFIESFIPGIRRKGSNNDNVNKTSRENSVGNETEEVGLGLLGMLHSYDGEFKQFGLFTPIDDILDRLKDVTGLPWGVVGCDETEMEDELLSSDEGNNKEDSDDDII